MRFALIVLSVVTTAHAADRPRDIIAHRGSCEERPENTLASIGHAMLSGATAVEVDVRWTKDRHLILLHDATLDRTTNGKGPVAEISFDKLRQLDAGTWFNGQYGNQRVPELKKVLAVCKGKISVMLDLKVQGQEFAAQVAADVRKHGDESATVIGVRSASQARQFRKLLPGARLYGLIPRRNDIEAFAKAGCETIRLWPRWLTDETLVPRVRAVGARLHLGAGKGKSEEVRPLLIHKPDSLSADNPARLTKVLQALSQ